MQNVAKYINKRNKKMTQTEKRNRRNILRGLAEFNLTFRKYTRQSSLLSVHGFGNLNK